MNKAVASEEWKNADMVGSGDWREQLSALADGQLQGFELNDALACAELGEGLETWELYHLVGDVLRSPELASPARPNFMARLRDELAKEPLPPSRSQEQAPIAAVVAPSMTTAANASVFRWKMVAGFASLAAVAAIGWNSISFLQGSSSAVGGGGQLAQSAAPLQGLPAVPTVAAVQEQSPQVMIRDPRLDELLAAHKQFGSTSTLQMPADFLRNATFEAPGR